MVMNRRHASHPIQWNSMKLADQRSKKLAETGANSEIAVRGEGRTMGWARQRGEYHPE